MGILHDLLLEAKTEQFEKDLKDAYGMGFRDGRLCGPDFRSCLADEKPAVFHRWVGADRAFLRFNVLLPEYEQREIWQEFHRTGFVPSGCSVEVQQRVVALVEFPDGSVGEVKPELIQFLDRGDERMG